MISNFKSELCNDKRKILEWDVTRRYVETKIIRSSNREPILDHHCKSKSTGQLFRHSTRQQCIPTTSQPESLGFGTLWSHTRKKKLFSAF